MPAGLAGRIVADAARALHYAHELRGPGGAALGVVHRDVSPENIIVTYTGHSKVLDFGIARWADRVAVTRHNVVRGKAAYMSPEQTEGRPLDRRSDVFALGIVLHEILCGRPLFPRGNVLEVMRAVQAAPIPDPREHVPDLPEALVTLLLRALERPIERRLESAEQLALGLEQALRAQGGLATTEDLAEHLLRQVSPQIESTEAPALGPAAPTDSSEGPRLEQPGAAPRRHTEVLGSPGPEPEDKSGRALGVKTAPLVEVETELDRLTTEPSPAVTPARGGARWVLLAVGGLAAGALLLFALTELDAEPTTPEESPAPLRLAGADAEVDDTPDAGSPSELSIAEGLPDRSAHDAAPISDAAETLRPVLRPRRRDAGRRPAPPRSQDRVPPAAEIAAQPGAETQASGSISVFATPWGNVRIDGKALGPTPLIGHQLSAGAHLVEVIAPDTNRVIERRQVAITPGGSVKVEVRSE